VGPAVQVGLLAVATGTALLVRRTASDAELFAFGCVAVPLVAPTATDLTLVVALPGLLVALVTEWRRGGRASLVLASLLAVHLGVYSVRLFLRYGPAHLPVADWRSLGVALVWVHPATAGLLAVSGLLGWRLYSGWRAAQSV
jgi:hypothetical protein